MHKVIEARCTTLLERQRIAEKGEKHPTEHIREELRPDGDHGPEERLQLSPVLKQVREAKREH